MLTQIDYTTESLHVQLKILKELRILNKQLQMHFNKDYLPYITQREMSDVDNARNLARVITI